ncbi:MerR family transcriptional regulator [Nocardia sp. NRRL S-836]|uniref:MerR family transcriptional regulator n=1 Tax=Nocardia sp. NRRL S-836 TaxID=1519492 RepID=UPI0006B00581|nr:MerR family transcriptional regulator [Nocardia sp. NRRL S-836]KOV88273.1 MerR family transcriptional regulator [Nocardia sp. NRRL S-836]
MTPETPRPDSGEPRSAAEKFDDDHYPAYTMGRAAEMLNTSAAFLRSLDEAKLIEPQRSAGGHRRYSRQQLRLAARVRTLLDEGIGLDAACRIVTLEDQLEEARGHNAGSPPDPMTAV